MRRSSSSSSASLTHHLVVVSAGGRSASSSSHFTSSFHNHSQSVSAIALVAPHSHRFYSTSLLLKEKKNNTPPSISSIQQQDADDVIAGEDDDEVVSLDNDNDNEIESNLWDELQQQHQKESASSSASASAASSSSLSTPPAKDAASSSVTFTPKSPSVSISKPQQQDTPSYLGCVVPRHRAVAYIKKLFKRIFPTGNAEFQMQLPRFAQTYAEPTLRTHTAGFPPRFFASHVAWRARRHVHIMFPEVRLPAASDAEALATGVACLSVASTREFKLLRWLADTNQTLDALSPSDVIDAADAEKDPDDVTVTLPKIEPAPISCLFFNTQIDGGAADMSSSSAADLPGVAQLAPSVLDALERQLDEADTHADIRFSVENKLGTVNGSSSAVVTVVRATVQLRCVFGDVSPSSSSSSSSLSPTTLVAEGSSMEKALRDAQEQLRWELLRRQRAQRIAELQEVALATTAAMEEHDASSLSSLAPKGLRAAVKLPATTAAAVLAGEEEIVDVEQLAADNVMAVEISDASGNMRILKATRTSSTSDSSSSSKQKSSSAPPRGGDAETAAMALELSNRLQMLDAHLHCPQRIRNSLATTKWAYDEARWKLHQQQQQRTTSSGFPVPPPRDVSVVVTNDNSTLTLKADGDAKPLLSMTVDKKNSSSNIVDTVQKLLTEHLLMMRLGKKKSNNNNEFTFLPTLAAVPQIGHLRFPIRSGQQYLHGFLTTPLDARRSADVMSLLTMLPQDDEKHHSSASFSVAAATNALLVRDSESRELGYSPVDVAKAFLDHCAHLLGKPAPLVKHQLGLQTRSPASFESASSKVVAQLLGANSDWIVGATAAAVPVTKTTTSPATTAVPAAAAATPTPESISHNFSTILGAWCRLSRDTAALWCNLQSQRLAPFCATAAAHSSWQPPAYNRALRWWGLPTSAFAFNSFSFTTFMGPTQLFSFRRSNDSSTLDAFVRPLWMKQMLASSLLSKSSSSSSSSSSSPLSLAATAMPELFDGAASRNLDERAEQLAVFCGGGGGATTSSKKEETQQQTSSNADDEHEEEDDSFAVFHVLLKSAPPSRHQKDAVQALQQLQFEVFVDGSSGNTSGVCSLSNKPPSTPPPSFWTTFSGSNAVSAAAPTRHWSSTPASLWRIVLLPSPSSAASVPLVDDSSSCYPFAAAFELANQAVSATMKQRRADALKKKKNQHNKDPPFQREVNTTPPDEQELTDAFSESSDLAAFLFCGADAAAHEAAALEQLLSSWCRHVHSDPADESYSEGLLSFLFGHLAMSWAKLSSVYVSTIRVVEDGAAFRVQMSLPGIGGDSLVHNVTCGIGLTPVAALQNALQGNFGVCVAMPGREQIRRAVLAKTAATAARQQHQREQSAAVSANTQQRRRYQKLAAAAAPEQQSASASLHASNIVRFSVAYVGDSSSVSNDSSPAAVQKNNQLLVHLLQKQSSVLRFASKPQQQSGGLFSSCSSAFLRPAHDVVILFHLLLSYTAASNRLPCTKARALKDTEDENSSKDAEGDDENNNSSSNNNDDSSSSEKSFSGWVEYFLPQPTHSSRVGGGGGTSSATTLWTKTTTRAISSESRLDAARTALVDAVRVTASKSLFPNSSNNIITNAVDNGNEAGPLLAPISREDVNFHLECVKPFLPDLFLSSSADFSQQAAVALQRQLWTPTFALRHLVGASNLFVTVSALGDKRDKGYRARLSIVVHPLPAGHVATSGAQLQQSAKQNNLAIGSANNTTGGVGIDVAVSTLGSGATVAAVVEDVVWKALNGPLREASTGAVALRKLLQFARSPAVLATMGWAQKPRVEVVARPESKTFVGQVFVSGGDQSSLPSSAKSAVAPYLSTGAHSKKIDAFAAAVDDLVERVLEEEPELQDVLDQSCDRRKIFFDNAAEDSFFQRVVKETEGALAGPTRRGVTLNAAAARFPPLTLQQNNSSRNSNTPTDLFELLGAVLVQFGGASAACASSEVAPISLREVKQQQQQPPKQQQQQHEKQQPASELPPPPKQKKRPVVLAMPDAPPSPATSAASVPPAAKKEEQQQSEQQQQQDFPRRIAIDFFGKTIDDNVPANAASIMSALLFHVANFVSMSSTSSSSSAAAPPPPPSSSSSSAAFNRFCLHRAHLVHCILGGFLAGASSSSTFDSNTFGGVAAAAAAGSGGEVLSAGETSKDAVVNQILQLSLGAALVDSNLFQRTQQVHNGSSGEDPSLLVQPQLKIRSSSSKKNNNNNENDSFVTLDVFANLEVREKKNIYRQRVYSEFFSLFDDFLGLDSTLTQKQQQLKKQTPQNANMANYSIFALFEGRRILRVFDGEDRQKLLQTATARRVVESRPVGAAAGATASSSSAASSAPGGVGVSKQPTRKQQAFIDTRNVPEPLARCLLRIAAPNLLGAARQILWHLVAFRRNGGKKLVAAQQQRLDMPLQDLQLELNMKQQSSSSASSSACSTLHHVKVVSSAQHDAVDVTLQLLFPTSSSKNNNLFTCDVISESFPQRCRVPSPIVRQRLAAQRSHAVLTVSSEEGSVFSDDDDESSNSSNTETKKAALNAKLRKALTAIQIMPSHVDYGPSLLRFYGETITEELGKCSSSSGGSSSPPQESLRLLLDALAESNSWPKRHKINNNNLASMGAAAVELFYGTSAATALSAAKSGGGGGAGSIVEMQSFMVQALLDGGHKLPPALASKPGTTAWCATLRVKVPGLVTKTGEEQDEGTQSSPRSFRLLNTSDDDATENLDVPLTMVCLAYGLTARKNDAVHAAFREFLERHELDHETPNIVADASGGAFELLCG